MFVSAEQRRREIELMPALVSAMSAKGIVVKPGDCAKTDADGTIWLPWLPEKATKDDILKFTCKGFHEQGHFFGESRPKEMGAGLVHRLTNGVDDVRCENLQEQKYEGLKEYRRPYYDLTMKDFGRKMFKSATKSNMPEFIHALNCLMIVRMRLRQLDYEIKFDVSKELEAAYGKYIEDLEDKILKQKTFDDSKKLGQKLYDRIKELVKDDELEKDPPPFPFGGGEAGEGDPEEGEGGASEPGEEEGDGEGVEPHGTGSSEEDEKARKEHADRLEWNTDRVMKGLETAAARGGILTIDDHTTADIEAVSERDTTYRALPGIKDVIRYNDYTEAGDPHVYLRKGMQVLGGVANQLTRLFICRTKPRILRNQEDGKLDLRAIISDHMDNRKDVRSRTKPASLDMAAVSIMMDNSGSMNGIRATRSYQILSALLNILNKARVPTECAGFTCEGARNSRYRDCPAIIDIVKKFEDPYNLQTMKRCIPPSFKSMNCEVDTLRWLAPRLMRRPEGKKIMIIFGDGVPIIGGGLDRRLTATYKTYIHMLRTLGVIVFGFGIDCNLHHIFGDDYLSVETGTMGSDILMRMKELLNRKPSYKAAV